MVKRRYLILGCLLLLAVWVGGCGQAEPLPTPTPTRTPVPQATATLPPTATPPPPTPTEVPTETPFVVTPLPPDVNPLTGLQVEDIAILERIPVAIKVSNSPQVRPQSGLGSADLVFEHLAEGGITRFTGVFYGSDPERVGSVRSGRLIDTEIPAMYGALFGYSGSSAGVKERYRNSDLFPQHIASPDFGVGTPYFSRVPQEGKAFEHTLFADPQALRQLAEERGINARPEYERYMTFSETPPDGGLPVEYFEINYLLNVCTAEWRYDSDLGKWRRSMAGTVHSDYLTGEQITADNVVIVYANHIEADFWEEMIGDMSRWKRSVEIQIWGHGPVLVLRDGQMFNGHWERAERNHMLTFWFNEEDPIPLKPGNTWFQMVTLGAESTEFADNQYRFTP